jgi:hypothetical protein
VCGEFIPVALVLEWGNVALVEVGCFILGDHELRSFFWGKDEGGDLLRGKQLEP